jgi:hypothetical protein
MDPFRSVLDLGRTGATLRWTVGAVTTAVVHLAAAASIVQERSAAGAGAPLEADEVEVEHETERAPAPPPEPEKPSLAPPAPRPVPALGDRKSNDDEPVQEPAQAGTVLTEDDDNAYDDSFVTGLGDAYAGGVTSGLGRSIASAHGSGQLGGSATGELVPAKPAGPDRSRPAWLVTNVVWDCGFPPHVDPKEIPYAAVVVAVTVKLDGRAESVDVVEDPGHGFGELAKQCALAHEFIPALDRDGRPLRARTRPFTIGFHPL